MTRPAHKPGDIPDPSTCVYQLFESQVRQSPDTVAVVFRDERLSYAELDSRVNQLAHYLKNLGVYREVLVGICAERGIDSLVGILAVLKAGGAYLPLDPEYPEHRLSFMLSDAEVTVLLTQEKLVERVSGLDTGAKQPTLVCLDTDWPSISVQPNQSLGELAAVNNLAYVIYTSGSTGEPKGVQIERRGLCNMAEAQVAAFGLQPSDRILQFSSLSFDASVFEIFLAFRAGATLVMVPPESRVPGPALTRLLLEQEVTMVTLPPSVLAALPREDLPALKIITVAGEACSAELVQHWARGRRFYNLYGPTEATVWATIAECVDGSQKPSIGRAILNTEVYLLDRDLQAVAAGEPGELCIGGAGLARGYLNRPQLNAEKFIPDPFHRDSNARLYRTGDMGRQLPDGNIEFIGRKDDQVKLRGFRIELGEVEATLRSHAGVRDAVVNLVQGNASEQQLVAYFVPDSSGWQQQVHESQSRQVAQWQSFHNETYGQPLDNNDPGLNITGWLDSYTGKTFDLEQMRRWRDHTVAQITALEPGRVYEIGCGSGMLLSRIAAGCEQYWGSDPSQAALNYVRGYLPELGLSDRVCLLERSADDFSELESADFDAVILNSVAQYFPDIDYLLKVLEGAVELVSDGGFVWVGDLRSLPLLEAFHTSVQFERAPDSMSIETLKQRVVQRMAEEQELVIDPAFFSVLRERIPAVSDICINLKRGFDENELTRFRYDVILKVGGPDVTSDAAPFVDWSTLGLSVDTLRQRLVDDSPEALCIAGVANARLQSALTLVDCLDETDDLRSIGDLNDLLARKNDVSALNPEIFWSLGSELGYETEISWSASGGPGCFDVLLWRTENKPRPMSVLPPADHAQSLKHYANNPIAGRIESEQILALRAFMEKKLPRYMMPAYFVLMDALPLTIQGKVDRRALPVPGADRSHLSSDYLAPRNSFEQKLVATWERVLKVEQIGVNDNFFELGGDSLLGAVLINALQQDLALEAQLYIVALFDAPTVAEQAVYLQTNFANEAGVKSVGLLQTDAEAEASESARQGPPDSSIAIEDIDEFSQLADTWHRGKYRTEEWTQAANPRMAFILAPPRSGSSLLRIMMAGHPGLFVPPELELLAFNSMQQRAGCLSGRLNFLREGLVRALMEIKSCDAKTAEEIVAEHEAIGDSVQTFYRRIQQWIGDRLLVDKSATYSFSPETLAHAEQGFADNIYIHLVRHPYGTIHSFEEARLDTILNFAEEGRFTTRQVAELTWLISHQNILSFLSNVPASRQLRVHFEQLVHGPRAVMEAVCDLMNIDFDPLMLEPYRHQEQRMVDGPNSLSVGMTDTKFHQHKDIEPGIADRWKTCFERDFLTDRSWRLAEDLGYEPETIDKRPAPPVTGNQSVTTVERVPQDPDQPPLQSYSQQRLWFIDRLAPGNPSYNTNRIIQIDGALDVAALERSLQEIINRHEVCRTNYEMRQGQPVQIIHPQRSFTLRQQDLTELAADLQNTRLEDIIRNEILHSFDLADELLCRALLICIGAQRSILIISIHHILSDAWSRSVLHQELSQLYDAFSHGRPSPLAPLPIQYADYAMWQRRKLSGDTGERLEQYWLQQMNAAPEMLELPTDRRRPRMQTYEGANKTVRLPDQLVAALTKFSRQQGATLFMTLLAAFNLLLSRYSRQSDIIVGIPVSGRTRAEFESMIGEFINILPIRTQLSEGSNFSDLLDNVRQTCLDAFAHQEYPFDLLVSKLKLERALDHHPLFQVMFAFHQPLLQDLNLPGLRCTSFNNSGPVPMPYDLTVIALDEPDGLDLAFDYNTDLFDAATIDRLADHYINLLQAIVSEPNQLLERFAMLAESEYQQLVYSWNQTATNYPREKAVHELFELQVEAAPDAIAVKDDDNSLSYRQLNERANRLAHYLRKKGVGPEVMVGLFMERSLDMIVGILGIVKAGGAYLSLDPEYPSQRINAMLEDSSVPVLLTQSALRERLPEFDGELICQDSDWPDIAVEPAINPESGVAAENRAYVIYTSGSTGTPKGVEVQHGGLMNLVSWHQQAYGVSSADCATHLASLGFDASVWELWPYLTSGASLYLVSDESRLSPTRLWSSMETQGITLSFLPTPLAEAMLREPLPQNLKLRVLLTGGDRLHGGLVASPLPFRVVNHYGPTENSVVTTYAEVDVCSSEDPPIGRPIDNVQAYILDTGMQPVPVGVWGELYIGGDSLARGYLNHAELTAEKFVINPFIDEPGARLYQSGDLARYREDGQIEFQGRIDHQVKIRGFRIELGEIETVLTNHEAVSDAAVIVGEGETGANRLEAYIVLSPETPPDPDFLRQYCRAILPEYMLPSVFVTLDALPLTPNGKVDRAALSVPDDQYASLRAEYAAPSTELEHRLAQIWCEVLKLDRVGINDNFFDLGGHSLMAAQIVSRVTEELDAEIPLSVMFNHPTVAEIAPIIEAANENNLGKEAQSIVPVARDRRLPLSFSQERLWFLDQLEPGSYAYNIPIALRLYGELDVKALQHGINAIIQRHESLRTTIGVADGAPYQQIAESLQLAMMIRDLSDQPAEQLETEVAQRAREEAQLPFDLSAGPLVRVSLLHISRQEHVLLLTLHHIVCDGWSMKPFYGELAELYRAFIEDRPPMLPDLAIQYADYSSWQRSWLTGENLERQLNYWKARLAGMSVLELPTDHPRTPVHTFRGGREKWRLSGPLLKELRRFCQGENTTLYMMMLSIFSVLLQRHSGQDDIVVGSPVAGRNRRELEGLIGFFLNSLVIRCDLSGDPSFREVVGRVREVVIEAIEYQELPFEKLVEELHPDREMSRNPLFQVMFNFVDMVENQLALPSLRSELIAGQVEATKFDLTLYVFERPDYLDIAFDYSLDLFEAETIREMLAHLCNLLATVTVDPQCRLSALPLLSGAQQREQRQNGNRVAPAVAFEEFQAAAIEDSIPGLFAQQVRDRPEQMAVITPNHRWTYRELDAESGRVTRLIHQSESADWERVALLFSHDAPMLAGLLGVLKAGQAYVPLDPTNPRERLERILADAQVSAIVTEQPWLSLAEQLGDGLAVIDIDAIPDIDGAPCTQRSPDSLSYLLYTSGSTGEPKAVMQNDRNVLHHVRSYRNSLHLNAQDRLTLLSSYTFDAAVMDIFGALLSGATLYPMDARATAVQDLCAWTREQEITVFHATPTVYRHFLSLLNKGDKLSTVRVVVLGGEAVIRDDVDLYRRHFSDDCLFVNGLGPTESTTALQYWIDRDTTLTRNAVPVGYPVLDTEVLLLNEFGEPTDLLGEIAISSPHVALGYWRQPGLTREKFWVDKQRTGSRIYRTGDLGRRRADGSIEFAGRKDQQLKVRGYRIEAGEVEAAICRHDAVERAAVVLFKDSNEEEWLTGYVVCKAGTSLDKELLRAYLKEIIPSYMIPAWIVELDDLPLTPGGKLDRRQLPAPEIDYSSVEAYTPPKTDTERRLTEIWEQVLSIKLVGIHDDFFDLGGHSLMATQVISRIQDKMHVKLPLNTLFKQPSVAGLALLIDEQVMATGASDSVDQIERADAEIDLAYLEELSDQQVEKLLRELSESAKGEL